jgi:hypothetical protein
MTLSNPRFSGQPTLEDTAAGRHRMVTGEPDRDAVTRIQLALVALGYPLPVHGADGNYRGETGTAVSAFKRDRGLVPSDPVVGVKTMAALNTETPPVDQPTPAPPPAAALDYGGLRAFYTDRAVLTAFPAGRPTWNPGDGFAANRATLLQVYGYYRDLHLQQPERFLWAGLGRMAGGAVLGGLQNPFLPDRSATARVMLRIGKDIFYDLAWLHEAFLDNPAQAIRLAEQHDRNMTSADYAQGEPPGRIADSPTKSYGEAFAHIDSGDPTRIVQGNRMLLANEQWTIIQPHYDYLMASLDRLNEFKLLRAGAFAENIHPYHRAFLLAFPQGVILEGADRWAWITEAGGMMEKWAAMGPDERNRLVAIDIDRLIRQDFDMPGRPDLLYPGSQ